MPIDESRTNIIVVTAPYNPLDYANLTRNVMQELMQRGPFDMPPASFDGAGVYALFYTGDLAMYAKIRSPKATWPIYVGKAVPEGARKGAKAIANKPSKPLFTRLKQHANSIQAASSTLNLSDFRCRYVVVTPLWITMAERFLIEAYQPVWNIHVDGFGNHDPGSGRYKGAITWWDVLHPGRAWATKLNQGRTKAEAKQRLEKFLATYALTPRTVTQEVLQEALEETVEKKEGE